MVVLDDEGVIVPVRSAHQRLLLSVLVAAQGRTLRQDELAESLWRDALPNDPNAALHSHMSRLRHLLGPSASWIETASPGYRLACPPETVDAVRFEHVVSLARGGDHGSEATLALLDEAMELWRGRAYVEFCDQPAIADEASRLEELRAEVAELRAELLLELGHPAEVVSTVAPLKADHPFRERPVGLSMRALAQAGRHADALAELDRFRRLLDDELGLEPSPELRAIEAAILRHEDRPAVPAIGVPGNSFVGRDAELSRTRWLLDHGRLVTLTGPGGIGKTRMALHVAAGVADAYPDGVYLFELAQLLDPDSVVPAVAAVLRVEPRAGASLTDRVIEFLQTKRALLVVDNCEHVLPAATELIAGILLRAPRVRILATSRERLGVEGEQRIPIGPLSTPAWDDPSGPSSVLFRDRARAVRPDMELRDDDLATVSELCRRLDGLPLAIELAAAQAVSSSPSEILDAVRGRLGELSDRRRTVERHRSLEAVFDWSYDLLRPAERSVFERLAVFAGGWTIEAAAAVMGATAADLAALVERSLVTAQAVGSNTRFSMLEPVRQFAWAKLSRSGVDEARRRHADWVVGFAEAAGEGLRGADEVAWRTALDAEFANARAAHRWCLDHDPEASVRLVASMYRYAWGAAGSEAVDWAAEVVTRLGDLRQALLPAAYATAAVGAMLRGDLAGSRVLAEAGIARASDDPGDARLCWEALGDVETFEGRFDAAVACYDRAIEYALKAGDEHQAAISGFDRALCPAYDGRADDAIEACEELAPLVETLSNPSLDAWSDYVNGEVRMDRSPTEALPLLRRSVDAARRIGNRLILGVAGVSAVSCEGRAGDPAVALAQYHDVIDHWHRAGAWNPLWATLRTMIEVFVRVGRADEAAVLYGAMTTSSTAPPLAGADVARIADAVVVLRARLGDRFEVLRSDGAALSDNEAVAFALRCVSASTQPSS